MLTKELSVITGKVGHVLLSSASGCRCCTQFDFLFLGYYSKSINLLDTALSQQSFTSTVREFYHFNKPVYYKSIVA